MERDEFLKSLGLGLAMVCTGSCLSGCGKGGDDEPKPGPGPGPGPGGNTATVNLSNQLMTVGDQVTNNGVLFFRIAAGSVPASFIATEAVCPHQGGNLTWKQADGKIQCQLHFSEYSTAGTVIQGPQGSGGTTRALRIYPTAVNGNTLTASIT